LAWIDIEAFWGECLGSPTVPPLKKEGTFTFDVELITRSHGPRPTELIESCAHDAPCRCDLALDQKPHGESRRMPAACRQPAEDCVERRVFVEMEWLGIEFGGKSLDLILVPDARIRRSAPP